MNQTETAKKITAYLDKGPAQLKAGTAYKLQAARQAALDAMRLPQHSPELALADSRGGSQGGGRPLRRRAAVDRDAAAGRRRSLFPKLADRAANARYRGNRCGALDLGAANRSVSGPGIPELAQTTPTLTARLLILGLFLATSVSSGLAASGPLVARPSNWADLSPSEKQVLAPLAPDWDKLDTQRKQKWLGIAQRYPTMPPDQQQRIQEQMGAWSRLTPDERRAARAQFKTLKQLPPEQRQEVRQKWQEYQQLPPEKKQELARPVAPAPPAPPAKATPATSPAPQ